MSVTTNISSLVLSPFKASTLPSTLPVTSMSDITLRPRRNFEPRAKRDDNGRLKYTPASAANSVRRSLSTVRLTLLSVPAIRGSEAYSLKLASSLRDSSLHPLTGMLLTRRRPPTPT